MRYIKTGANRLTIFYANIFNYIDILLVVWSQGLIESNDIFSCTEG